MAEAGEEAAAVGNLDGEAGPGVGFEHDGTAVGIENEIHSEVIQFQNTSEAHGGGKKISPVRNDDAGDRCVGVGVIGDDPVLADAAKGFPALQIHSGGDGALVEVGAAAGGVRRQPYHGHDGDAAVEDDTDVGCAADGNRLEDGMADDALFDDDAVGLAAEGVETGEDGFEVVMKIRQSPRLAAGGGELFLVVSGHDDDAAAPGAFTGFDDELLVVADEPGKLAEVALVFDDGVGLRDGNPVRFAEAFGQELVVHAWIMGARVARQNELGVAAVDAEHAKRPEFLG